MKIFIICSKAFYDKVLDVKNKLESNGYNVVVTDNINVTSRTMIINRSDISEEKIKTLPLITGKDARNFTRFFFSSAIECEFDSQGRILISQGLRTFANLEKELVIIGVSSRIEIWSKEKWESYNDDLDSDDIAEKMTLLGI